MNRLRIIRLLISPAEPEPEPLIEEEIEKNVIAKELALQVEAADLDLANYKIAAALQVKVPGDTGEGTQNTTDFFIFTVTRLKTDL